MEAVSLLNIFDTVTGQTRTLRRFEGVIEAPNWIHGQNKLLYNSGGRIYTCDVTTGAVERVETGECTGCNNDHVIAPGEDFIAVSHGGVIDGEYVSKIYILPIGGGEPRLVRRAETLNDLFATLVPPVRVAETRDLIDS